MTHLIGGIEFPQNIVAKKTDGRLFLLRASGDVPIIGWEFCSPTISPVTLIIKKPSIEDAARIAYEWFGERGHLNMATSLLEQVISEG